MDFKIEPARGGWYTADHPILKKWSDGRIRGLGNTPVEARISATQQIAEIVPWKFMHPGGQRLTPQEALEVAAELAYSGRY